MLLKAATKMAISEREIVAPPLKAARDLVEPSENVIMYVAQIGHAKRLEAEAAFHHKSVDARVHTSYFHRLNSWLNFKLRKLLMRFEIQESEEGSREEEATIAPPFRVMLITLLMVFFLLVVGGPALCFGFSPSTATVYLTRNSANSLYMVYIALLIAYMMTDLRKTAGRKLELFFMTVSLAHIFPFVDVWLGEVSALYWTMTIFYSSLILAAQVIWYRAKTLVLNEVDVDTRKKHAHKVFAGAMAVVLPSVVLASERIGCLVRFKDDQDVEEGNFAEDPYCKSIYLGTESIMTLLAFTFTYASVFLERRVEEKGKQRRVTVRNIVTLQLTKIALTQVLLLGLAAIIAISLYGVREEGAREEFESVFEFMMAAVVLIILVIASLAFVDKFVKSASGAEDREESLSSSLDEKISNLSQSSKDLFGVKKHHRATTMRGSEGKEGRGEEKDEEVFGTTMMNINPGV